MKFKNEESFDDYENERDDEMIENAREQMEYQRDEEIWDDILNDLEGDYLDNDFF
ncbi:hypothetical protein [Myroides marinus]|uniref:hypothetical protein n=1 Tax=Myroides marinus TaxID=703342 RepID=UPI000AA9160D|nr:hypothetical protein [Myroides marinus]